ncbi:MAG TPA: uL13 family ribosomal protein [Candidatus Paceibacterota bacterium]|nr:uL13 family ribosomal protein [Candidatus Paceibacterota bacterium]
MTTLERMPKDLRNRVDHTVAPVEYTVDAAGRTLGRVASEAASALLGKKSVHFLKTKVLPVKVTIINAKKLKLSEKRLSEKKYRYYTGHVGGLREFSLPMLLEKKGVGEALRMAVDGMIPRNKLRKERMKRLTIKD